MAALVGLGTPELKMSLSAVVHRELIVFGTSIYPTSQYAEMWEFFREHQIAPSQVVTHRFPIDQGAEAFQLADTATTGRSASASTSRRGSRGGMCWTGCTLPAHGSRCAA